MRVKTQSGHFICIPDDSVISQEKHVTKHEVFYTLHLSDGKSVNVMHQVVGIATSTVDHRKKNRLDVTPVNVGPSYNPVKLLDPNECESAGGAMCAVKAEEEFDGEKYKGETFSTHKSSVGLVIKKGGQVVHETKMSDMYKRRD